MKWLDKNALLLIQVVCLVPLVLVALIVDAFGASLSWWYCAKVVGAAVLFSLPAFLSRERKKSGWLLAGFVAVFLGFSLTTHEATKPFMRFYHGIKVGMTQTQVRSALATQFPANGRFPRPLWRWENGSRAQVMMDPTHDRVDSVFVTFQGGRVVNTEFMGD